MESPAATISERERSVWAVLPGQQAEEGEGDPPPPRSGCRAAGAVGCSKVPNHRMKDRNGKEQEARVDEPATGRAGRRREEADGEDGHGEQEDRRPPARALPHRARRQSVATTEEEDGQGDRQRGWSGRERGQEQRPARRLTSPTSAASRPASRPGRGRRQAIRISGGRQASAGASSQCRNPRQTAAGATR